jgi:hypothetical protein
VGLERVPLTLVSTSSSSGLENREYGLKDLSHLTTFPLSTKVGTNFADKRWTRGLWPQSSLLITTRMSHSWCAVSVGEAILPASSSVTSYCTQRVSGDSWARHTHTHTHTHTHARAHTRTHTHIITVPSGGIKKHSFLGHNILWASINSESFLGNALPPACLTLLS